MKDRINPLIKEDIEKKLAKIEEDSDYYKKRREAILQEIRSLGDIYSFWIENPSLRRSLLVNKEKIGRKQPKTIQKYARKGIHNIKNAWYYLYNLGTRKDIIEELDTDILKKVNRLVEPKVTGTGKLRKVRATLGMAKEGYTPPNPIRVPEKIDELLYNIKSNYREYPLESAIGLHLGIVAIQPFIEGNKRTGRLIQNALLHNADIPPVIIPAGEGEYYFGILKKVLPHYWEGDIEYQKQFYDYCASKVNNGLDEILGDLEV